MVSVLIVNRNGKAVLSNCLNSIASRLKAEHEVIVVDNASTDASADSLQQDFPHVKLIRSQDNLGFARGNNLAALHASGEYLLLLNNDTLLQTSISDALSVLDADQSIGAVGAAMFRGDGALAFSCAHFPAPMRLWLFSSLWFTPKKSPLHINGVKAFRCDYVEGSFLLTRASAWHQLGGMDVRNYMYGDDVEYCRSLFGLGLLTVHCPSIRYTHFGGYDHSKMGYLYAGFRRYHRKFSTRAVQREADFVLRVGLLLRLPWYWMRAQIKGDPVSHSALRHALALHRDWASTLTDSFRFHS